MTSLTSVSRYHNLVNYVTAGHATPLTRPTSIVDPLVYICVRLLSRLLNGYMPFPHSPLHYVSVSVVVSVGKPY